MRRALGVLLVIAAAAAAAFGALWAFLAIVGREWDYCPGGSRCIAGELVGGVIMLGGAAVALLGVRLGRRS